MDQFPPSIWVYHYGHFEFFRLKVHHRCQRHRWQIEKIFKQKNFNNFVWAPLGSRVNIYINFCLLTLRCLQPDIVPIIFHRCCWHRWCTLTCEYLREFSKNFEMILMLFSGAWGKVNHEKNLKQKISWHCPFKRVVLKEFSNLLSNFIEAKFWFWCFYSNAQEILNTINKCTKVTF
jgi:hypothetical protein